MEDEEEQGRQRVVEGLKTALRTQPMRYIKIICDMYTIVSYCMCFMRYIFCDTAGQFRFIFLHFFLKMHQIFFHAMWTVQFRFFFSKLTMASFVCGYKSLMYTMRLQCERSSEHICWSRECAWETTHDHPSICKVYGDSVTWSINWTFVLIMRRSRSVASFFHACHITATFHSH